MADVTRILADHEISIDAVLQKEAEEGEDVVDVIILTHRCLEEQANAAIAKIEALASMANKVVRIRLEELN
jgi:homoserine dehydrogenase